MIEILTPPSQGAVGYSCQPWISRLVNEFLHPGSYYCWFASEFDPIRNGDSSSPAWLYLTIDRAVKQNDVNHPKIKDIRANLMRAVVRELACQGCEEHTASVIKTLEGVDIICFRPQVWKIDLNSVPPSRYSSSQYPDEYLIRELRKDEFQVIID